MKKITVPDILKMKDEGIRIPVLTAYGFPMARLLDEAGIPVLMVGDSQHGRGRLFSTIPVTIDEIIYHTRQLRRKENALVVSDMPGSYQISSLNAKKNLPARKGERGGRKLEGAEGRVPP